MVINLSLGISFAGFEIVGLEQDESPERIAAKSRIPMNCFILHFKYLRFKGNPKYLENMQENSVN